MTRWQAIIFDLDDTLYPERDYVISGFRAVATWAETRFGIKAEDSFTYLYTLFQQGVRGDTFNRWLVHFGVIQDDNINLLTILIPQLIEIYRTHQPSLTLFPEAAQALPDLCQQYRLGLVSDGYLITQQRKLAGLNLAPYLTAVVFSDQWGRTAWKPSTIPFLAALEKLQVAPSEAVYVADNPTKDFYGPRQLGMETIWLKHAQGDYADQKPPSSPYEPDLVMNTWTEFNYFLKGMPLC